MPWARGIITARPYFADVSSGEWRRLTARQGCRVEQARVAKVCARGNVVRMYPRFTDAG